MPLARCQVQFHSGDRLNIRRTAFSVETSKPLLRMVLAAAGANVHAVMPVRLFPRCTRSTRAVSAPIGRFEIAAVSHRRTRNGHCSCSRCSGCHSPSRAIIRAEMQRILLYRLMSQAPCLLGYCVLHACADAQGRASDCAVGPAAAAAASLISASVVRDRAGPAVAICALPTHAAHARRPSCGTFTLDRLDRCIDSAAACSPPSWSPLMRH